MTPFLTILLGVTLAAYLLHLSRVSALRSRTGYEVPALALTILAGAAAWQLAHGDQPPITLISALLVAISALFGLVFNAAVSRQQADRLREEKRSDIKRALRAEIDAHVRAFEDHDWGRDAERARVEFLASDSYRPFLPRRSRDRVLAKVLDKIEVLDDEQVEKVIRYYTLAENIAQFVDDIRSKEFGDLPANRKIAIFSSLMRMEDTLVDYGLDALSSLGDPVAAERLNRRGRARSAQEAAA